MSDNACYQQLSCMPRPYLRQFDKAPLWVSVVNAIIYSRNLRWHSLNTRAAKMTFRDGDLLGE